MARQYHGARAASNRRRPSEWRRSHTVALVRHRAALRDTLVRSKWRWPSPGETFGNYRIEHCLGSGGMGTVFSAWDSLLERPVAIKLLHGDHASQLLEEARALAAVVHPNVVRLFELNASERGSFVVMERIVGDDLARTMDRGQLGEHRCVEIVRDIACALGVIHEVGWVHGDVKPSNVILERDTGRVVLTDFGLCRRMEKGAARDTVSGTPEYLAPERCIGATVPRELAGREDVYSLAVMAFEMLTGRLPFELKSAQQLLWYHAHAEPPRPSDVRPLPWRVDRAILAGLAKDPELRTATPARFARALELALRRGSEPARVLVADDDPEFRGLLAVGLARRVDRLVVESVADGDTAYDVASQRLPDLAIVDLEMPGQSGLELAAMLRTLGDVPVVVVSGRAKPRDVEALSRAGVLACLPKPVRVERLASVVRDVLRGGRELAALLTPTDASVARAL
jgi:CheY-like chemotaxis protein